MPPKGYIVPAGDQSLSVPVIGWTKVELFAKSAIVYQVEAGVIYYKVAGAKCGQATSKTTATIAAGQVFYAELASEYPETLCNSWPQGLKQWSEGAADDASGAGRPQGPSPSKTFPLQW